MRDELYRPVSGYFVRLETDHRPRQVAVPLLAWLIGLLMGVAATLVAVAH